MSTQTVAETFRVLLSFELETPSRLKDLHLLVCTRTHTHTHTQTHAQRIGSAYRAILFYQSRALPTGSYISWNMIVIVIFHSSIRIICPHLILKRAIRFDFRLRVYFYGKVNFFLKISRECFPSTASYWPTNVFKCKSARWTRTWDTCCLYIDIANLSSWKRLIRRMYTRLVHDITTSAIPICLRCRLITFPLKKWLTFSMTEYLCNNYSQTQM